MSSLCTKVNDSIKKKNNKLLVLLAQAKFRLKFCKNSQNPSKVSLHISIHTHENGLVIDVYQNRKWLS